MKTFPLQLEDELHRKLKHAAIDAGKPLHEWIIEVLRAKVDDGRNAEPSTPERQAENEKSQ